MLLTPSSQGLAPGLNRNPPGLLANDKAVQRKMRRHCWLKAVTAAGMVFSRMSKLWACEVTRLCQLSCNCVTGLKLASLSIGLLYAIYSGASYAQIYWATG